MRAVVCILTLVLGGATAAQIAPQYRYEMLPLGYMAKDVNRHGDVLVDAPSRDKVRLANGQWYDLHQMFYSAGIRDDGMVYGSMQGWYVGVPSQELVPVLLNPVTGARTLYRNPVAQAVSSDTSAINAGGQSVGQLYYDNYSWGVPFRYNTTTTGDILRNPDGTPAIWVTDINDAGYAIGDIWVAGLGEQAGIWAPGATRATMLRAEGRSINVHRINNSGWITATPDVFQYGNPSYVLDVSGSVLHSISLGAGKSIGLGNVTDDGVLSGGAGYAANPNTSDAYLWSVTTGLVKLRDRVIDFPTSAELLVCKASSSGTVIAWGRYTDEPSYILTPVPEPASLIMLGLGTATLLRRRRHW